MRLIEQLMKDYDEATSELYKSAGFASNWGLGKVQSQRKQHEILARRNRIREAIIRCGAC